MIARSIVAVALCASLGACATTSQTVDVGKAIAAGWAGLDGAAKASDVAVHLGKLKGAQAATVSADLTKASAALKIATDVYTGAAGASGADPAVEAAIAAAAVAEITAILVPLKP